MRLPWLGILVAACGRGGGGEQERTLDGPIRVALGPCAEAGTRFESGPLPSADGGATGGRHVPDRGSLRGDRSALADCFRKQRKPYAVVVVDLTYAATGEVSAAVAHGVDGNAASCIAEVARKANPGDPAARGTGQRCSLAFGTMPLADLPSIDITASELTWRGRSLADPRRLLADPSPPPRIVPLHEALTGERATFTASAAPVALSGPVLLRPLDNTPMKIVTRAAGTAVLAGFEVVPAAQRDPAWRSLRELELPVVPVPLGDGRQQPGTGGADAAEPERITISVLVTTDQLWIGRSVVNEFDAIPRLAAGHDWDRLLIRLREHKAAPGFADRADLEIAGEDPVPYIDVVRSIDVATDAGFVDWQLLDPAALSARPIL